MTLAELSIKRPIFVTCIALATVAVGYLSYKNLGVDMLPNVTFPVVTVTVPYPGASPAEIETLVSKQLSAGADQQRARDGRPFRLRAPGRRRRRGPLVDFHTVCT